MGKELYYKNCHKENEGHPPLFSLHDGTGPVCLARHALAFDPVLPISLLWLKLGSPLISVAGVLIPGPLSTLLTASSR
jgi:hypothetical protein